MKLRFYLDPGSAKPHIHNHGVREDEVEEVLRAPSEDRPGRDGARVAIGLTREGRYLKVIYIRDDQTDSLFIITAFPLRGRDLRAAERRTKNQP